MGTTSHDGLGRRAWSERPGQMNLVLLLLAGLAATPCGALVSAASPPAEGERLWEFSTGGAIESSPALGEDGTVYFGSRDGRVYAVDGRSGTRRWDFPTGDGMAASPVIGPGGMVLIRAERQLLALDGATGEMRWVIPASFCGIAVSPPAVGSDGTVYFGNEGSLTAVDGRTGAHRWNVGLVQPIPYCALSPAIGPRGRVYVACSWWQPFRPGGSLVSALEGSTGALLWSQTGLWRSPVILGTTDPPLLCSWPRLADAATGRVLGEFPNVSGTGENGIPSIGTNGWIYVGEQVRLDGVHTNVIAAFDPSTLAMVWAFPVSGLVLSSPAIAADGTVVVGSHNRHVYALHGGTGALRWSFKTGNAVRSSPAIGPDGSVFVGSDDGRLYALRGSAGLADSPWPKFRCNAGNTGNTLTRSEGVPTIASQPQGLRVPIGTAFELGVVAVSTLPLFYQWQRDGQPIPGATNAVCTVAQATLAHAGSHRVVVANDAGSVTSAVARVVVGYTLTLASDGVGSIEATPREAAYAPDESVTLTALPGEGRGFVQWTGDAVGSTNPLIVRMDRSRTIRAHFSRIPGDQLWSFATSPWNDYGQPVLGVAVGEDETVYAVTEREIVALNGVTGATRWRRELDRPVQFPALGPDDTVFVTSWPGNEPACVRAIDPADGTRRWESLTGAPVATRLAVGADGTVYTALSDRRLVAWNGRTGVRRWEISFAGSDGLTAPAVSLDGNVYIVRGHVVHALNAATGRQRWESALGTNAAYSFAPSIGDDGTVYVGRAMSGGGTGSGRVHALDGATGRIRWSYDGGQAVANSPTVGPDGTLHVVSGVTGWAAPIPASLASLDPATGTARRVLTTPGLSPGPAVGADNTFYLATEAWTLGPPWPGGTWWRTSRLVALDGETGTVLWTNAAVGQPALGSHAIVYCGETAIQTTAGLARSAWPNIDGDARNARLQSLPGEGPPVMVQEPRDQTIAEGDTAFLTAAARGSAPLSYEWRSGGSAVADGHSAWLILTNFQAPQAGDYVVVIANSLGAVTSRVARLTLPVSEVLVLGFQREADRVVLRWSDPQATVQTTASLGPPARWEPVPGTSPLTVRMNTAGPSFYRLLRPGSGSPRP